jgi:PAS domain S-box-containing protein
MSAMPTAEDALGDPALQAVRALLAAMPSALAVLDADGTCLGASRWFQPQAAPHPADIRTAFSPDGVRRWTIVSRPTPTAASTAPQGTFNESIVNALPMMCNAKDLDSRYLFMNRFQAEIYGIDPVDAVGCTAAQILGASYGAYTRDIDLQVIRSGRPMPFFEESYAGADGVVRRWLSSKVPLTRDDGTVWGVATVSIDITERNRLEEGLRQAKRQAETANRVKSGFLAAMSHELRTPLNAVIGFGEIMHQEALGPIGVPEYRDYAGHILRSGQHLLSLINDVLDFARIESGSLKLVLGPVDLGAMVRAVLDVLAGNAETAGVMLATELTPQRIVLVADQQRLRQALLNIAGNAVKFTQAGGRVSVALAPGEAGGAVITVTDSGIGIEESQMAAVFDAFWQADSGLDRVKAGTGIGLPLARQLIALHGGRLELQSRLGEGTCVTITLPAAAPAPLA